MLHNPALRADVQQFVHSLTSHGRNRMHQPRPELRQIRPDQLLFQIRIVSESNQRNSLAKLHRMPQSSKTNQSLASSKRSLARPTPSRSALESICLHAYQPYPADRQNSPPGSIRPQSHHVVVPASSLTIATSRAASRFIKLDFPAFGAPTNAILTPDRIRRPRL
jgi:hypothetical protein